MRLSKKAFQKIVYDYYKMHGRDFPWRHTKNPYHIFISEIMLQQTQADRVIEKYTAFIKTFPTVKKLSEASTTKIYGLWSGLGYNRRALALNKASKIIVSDYNGKIPNTPSILETLPGVGPYTASAIMVFAFNEPSVVIETNIRTVFIYHFFSHKKSIRDEELSPYIEKMMDKKNPGKWYSALMDYGTYLKKTHGNLSKQSITHTKQKPFKGSKREIRGNALRALHTRKYLSKQELIKLLDKENSDITTVLDDLMREGFIKRDKAKYRIK